MVSLPAVLVCSASLVQFARASALLGATVGSSCGAQPARAASSAAAAPRAAADRRVMADSIGARHALPARLPHHWDRDVTRPAFEPDGGYRSAGGGGKPK